MSDTIGNLGALYAALAKAQGEMGSAVMKDSVADVGRAGRRTYASLAAVRAHACPHLAANGLSLFDRMDGGCLVCTLAHESGAIIESIMPIYPTEGPQALGSQLTYGRRYLAMGLLGLAPEDDDGQAGQDGVRARKTQAPPRRDPPQRPAPPIHPADLAQPMKWLASNGLTPEDAEKAIGKPLAEAITDRLWPIFVAKVASGETTADTIWGRTAREAAGK